MSFAHGKPTLEASPVLLDVTTLERITAAARFQGYTFRIAENHLDGFRYFVYRKTPMPSDWPRVALMSNDIADVARFLGIRDNIQEPALSEGVRPTVRHTFDEFDNLVGSVEGAVELQEPVTPAHCVSELPRGADGFVDGTSEQFTDRAHALRLKTRAPLRDCKLALCMAEGIATKALHLLENQNFFATRV